MNTVRFNPLMERYEALTHGDGERRAWAPIVFGSNEPTIFINLVPLEYKVPDGQWFPVAFTATYLCRRKSLWERLVDWLWRLLPSRQRGVVVRSQWRVASAIEAATAGETTQIGSTEGESAVAKPDAQPHPLNPVCKEGGNS